MKKKKIENEVMTKPTAGYPPRALTSYNLFYRFKRFKILQALEEAGNNFSEEERSKHIVTAIVAATPGLESYPSLIGRTFLSSSSNVKELRRNEIHAVFHHENLSPKKRIRAHHRGPLGGHINTHELTRLISASWKDLDNFSRSIFDELANESKLIHLKRVAKFETSTAATDKAMALSAEAAENLINSDMALGSTDRSGDGNAKASIMVTTATTDKATATVEADLDKLAEAAANNIMVSTNVKAAGPSPEAMSLPNLLKNDTTTSTICMAPSDNNGKSGSIDPELLDAALGLTCLHRGSSSNSDSSPIPQWQR